ncbi:alpha-amylase [Oceanobacillus iheyensis HTE831]|uniref:Alpha-amylase n=1 Tax=Oceanobacillus iheyensis (strain DSM 14371 / CIP 107618 / JCM 11309 / KCTC 3954 / HTE831) TaxID=221109 RepID=Q8ERW2_OCEIH|nr:alpha-amylase family glycosyl hydrolase [Oceanobacillus iheyensis]BAC13141.1 alpha-amylase [Oceanobacillus iheyensis HTE831]
MLNRNKLLLLLTVIFVLLPVTNVNAEEPINIHNEIIYDILVDRFNNGDSEETEEIAVDDPNAYHGGDIKGIIDQLDRLKEMGITTISLSPLMTNQQNGYHGYWVLDYFEIDEQLGTMEDLNQLIEQAHQRDMKVVMDMVINYAAASHEVTEDETKADWWTEPSYTAASWSANALQWNLNQPEVAENMINVADYWMEETEIDGFTLHAVDQAPIDFLQEYTQHIKETDEEFYLIGDILDPESANIQELEETPLDIVANPMLHERLKQVFSDVDNPVSEVYHQWENLETDSPLITIDNFTEERFTNAYSKNQRNSLTAWTLALTYMYTTPGTPLIVQGTELPMYGGDEEESQRLVPFNSGDPELKEFHTRIASLRNEFPALRQGDIELVDTVDSMIVYKRSYEGQTMYVAINNGSESAYVDVTDVDANKELRGHLQDNLVRENQEGNHRIGIPRESVEVYEVQDDHGLNWWFIGFIVMVILAFIAGVIYLTIKQRKREKK